MVLDVFESLVTFLERLAEKQQQNKMCPINYPEYLNTTEKWNNYVRNTATVKDFEEVFHNIVNDANVSMVDVFRIMKKFERDVILVHENVDISCVMDIFDSVIRYLLISTVEAEKAAEALKEAGETSEKTK